MSLPGKVHCREGEEGDSSAAFTTLAATSRSEGVTVAALKVADKTHQISDINLFSALLAESQGGMSIVRSIEAVSRTESFVVSGAGNEITSATITPPKSFTGSATYERKQGSTATWTGSLAGEFLGRGTVSLAGPQFTASVH